MAIIKTGRDWAGTSRLPSGTVVPNHDSKLTWEEVVALVNGLNRLPGFGPGIDGFSVAKPSGIPEKIWALAEALRKATTEVVVEKGLHQRHHHPHIRIILSRGAASYHVMLSAAPGGAGVTGFNWTTVGVTFVTAAAKVLEVWPAAFSSHVRLPGGRRTSISVGTRPPAPTAVEEEFLRLGGIDLG